MGKAVVANTGIFSTLEGLGPVTDTSDNETDIPDNDLIQSEETPKSTKERLEDVYSMLEDIRLNMTESAGQGFLFNAQHQIQSLLVNYMR